MQECVGVLYFKGHQTSATRFPGNRLTLILSARNLSKTYGSTKVLHGLNMDIEAGASVAILGQSGSGKTTLLSLLAGLEQPDTGQIVFQEQDLGALSVDALARWRGRSMGIIFQEYHLVPSLTAKENVALPMEIQGEKQSRVRAESLLDRVGLASRGHHYPHQLSDGTVRFICLATLLLQPTPPATILIDEPELGLHPFAIKLLASLLHEAAQRVQLIVSTQSSLLLDELTPEEVIVVNHQQGESVLERLDAERLASWLEEYTLGQLWEKNTLGGLP